MSDVADRLLTADPTLFDGDTATRALGWLRHPERYLGKWLDDVAARLPRRRERAVLIGMGGSSSPARLYAEARPGAAIDVLDTSNPDTVGATAFHGATVIAASKSGTTIEVQTLLARALSDDLDPADLVVITDPGTSLEELARHLGATTVLGDPETGGRFSGLSPFGLVPAIYAGWTPDELRDELDACRLTRELVDGALDAARDILSNGETPATLGLARDPATSGGALWLEQLVAETTGKNDRGVVPVVVAGGAVARPRDVMHWHVVASLLARDLGVDPFNQPDVETAKRDVFSLLTPGSVWDDPGLSRDRLRDEMASAAYVTLQVFAPLEDAPGVESLREGVEAVYGTTTANLGPRYLHSTGQLHKGGP
ncbi:MAG: hypothetical protein ACRDV0_04730, partial [Acidimicrobiales bacterium]